MIAGNSPILNTRGKASAVTQPVAFITAGISSSTGKTTATLGLMAALRKRGMTVQPFKAGPDYIDPSHHQAVCGRPSYNLDTWMMGTNGVKGSFARAMRGADAGIIEGVMGLFDGKGGGDGEGSTAHLAKILVLPVILVIDAKGMAHSAAALIHGFERFDPEVRIAGVIFNRVGSTAHYRILKGAVENSCNARVLGYLPWDEDITMPERHLGLVMAPPGEDETENSRIKGLVELMERYVDLDGVLACGGAVGGDECYTTPPDRPAHSGRPVIAVAYDNAFCFYYRENLDMLEELGADLVYFSPLSDGELPEGTAGIYLGGGYPELYAETLSSNRRLLTEIRTAAERGIPIYAECGGLMYLGMELRDLDGKAFELTRIFPWTSTMLPRRRFLGYREVIVNRECPFLGKGHRMRGHEFHYSEITLPEKVKCSYSVTGTGGDPRKEEGYLYKNTLASYVHIHFASNPGFPAGFVGSCADISQARSMRL